MFPCGISSVSLLPFIYCCPSNPVILHTLNKLPFAPDTTLIMKPLLSFWFSYCLNMFISSFWTSCTTTSRFIGWAVKNSLSVILYNRTGDYHTIINSNTISSIQHVPICQALTHVNELCSPLCPIIVKNTFYQWRTGRFQWTFMDDSIHEQSIFYPYLWRFVPQLPW